MTWRSRLGFVVAWLTLALAGCDESSNSGPILYRDSERFARELANKPQLQATIRQALAQNFGDHLRQIRVPDDSGLRDDGRYLASHVRTGDRVEPVTEVDPNSGRTVAISGGYAVYRKNCLQCHGVFGAGDGPTSEYLYPRPRDYRRGVFKFTSTNPVDAKPSRADLRKTILYGLHGTSMPGFEALMTASEIDQVIDYMTFLSFRGETERYLIDEATSADDKDAATALDPETVKDIVAKVTSSWKDAETQVVTPSARRVTSSPESIQRGRDLYLATNPALPKLECVGCHGTSGRGDGGAFIEPAIFRNVALRFWSLDQAVADFYRKDHPKLATKPTGPSSAELEGVATFLRDNPAVVAQLRTKRAWLAEVPDPAFAEKLTADPQGAARSALALLPELADPDFRPLLVAKLDLWTRSLDVWENPLRPANLLEGTYKGGRRPIDLYWRIAKGINGAKMPAHSGLLTDEQIWDVVNFVLAVPEEPGLLPDSAPVPARGHDPGSSGTHAVSASR